MYEIEFVQWLKAQGVSSKLCSDCVSRIKRIERSIKDCDIDEEYEKDRCEHLLSLFINVGKNKEMEMYLIGDLPIGKYYLSAFSYSVRKYVIFKDAFKSLDEN